MAALGTYHVGWVSGVTYGSDDAERKSCFFAVGVTDSLYFWTSADDKDGVPSCSAAKDVANDGVGDRAGQLVKMVRSLY